MRNRLFFIAILNTLVLSQQRDWVKVTSSAGFSDREDHSSVVFDNKMWVIAGGEKNSNNL